MTDRVVVRVLFDTATISVNGNVVLAMRVDHFSMERNHDSGNTLIRGSLVESTKELYTEGGNG